MYEIVEVSKETPYTLLPRSIFKISSYSRAILLLSYFYSMAMTNDSFAIFSYNELRKILSVKNPDSKEGNKIVRESIRFLEDSGIITHREKGKAVLVNILDLPDTLDIPELFFRFPKIVLLLPVSARAKLLLIFLYSMRKKGNSVKVSRRTIERECRIKRDDITSLLNELSEIGVIKINKTPGKKSEYILIEPQNWSEAILQDIIENYEKHPFVTSFIKIKKKKIKENLTLEKTYNFLELIENKYSYLVSRYKYKDLKKYFSKIYEILGERAETFIAIYFYLRNRGLYKNIENHTGFLLSLLKKEKELKDFLETFSALTGYHIPVNLEETVEC